MLPNFKKRTTTLDTLDDFLIPECLTITSPFREDECFINFRIPDHIQQMALDVGKSLLILLDKVEGHWGGVAWKTAPATWSEDHEKIRTAVKELLVSLAHCSSEAY